MSHESFLILYFGHFIFEMYFLLKENSNVLGVNLKGNKNTIFSIKSLLFKRRKKPMAEEERKCPYCGISLRAPYWRHIESKHPKEYASDKNTWLQLFEDYTSMGMDKESSISVICQIFNREPGIVKNFLKNAGKL